MLSALAKYIFGGVMGDAPETTPMQYETREINDWLLVDTPDQAIDDEDMDSEYDEDEILTAVPLLMDEEESVIPRQIVLSYEASAICDNTCGKLRKDFHKLCPASSKGQVHHGDKIQGNCINNVEAISLKSGNGKLQDKLNEIKINSKSKKSRARKNKPKNSKRSKVQSKIAAKCSDSSSTIKETYDDQYIRENSNDSKLNENVKKIESGDEIKTEFATDYDNSVAISKSSIDKIENPTETSEVGDLNDMMEDSGDFVWKNFFNIPEKSENKNIHGKSKTAELDDQNKIELAIEDHDNSFAILKNSSDKELSSCETFQKHVPKGILEDSEDFDLEAFFNEEYTQDKSKNKNFNEKSKKTVPDYLNKIELATEDNGNSLPKSKNSSDKIQSASNHFQKNNFSDIPEDSEGSAWKKICKSHSQSSSKQEHIKRSSSDRTESIFKNYDEEFPEIDSGVLELFEEVYKKCDSLVKKDYDSKINTSLSNKKQNNLELKENSNKSKKCRSKKAKKCGFQDKFGKISSTIHESQIKGLNSHIHADSYAEKESKMQFVPLEIVDGKVNNFNRNASSNLQSILPAELQDDAIQDIFEDDSSEHYTNAHAERLVTIKEDLRNEGICGDEFKNFNSNTQKEINTRSLESYETISESNADESKFISSELQISSKYPDRSNMTQNSAAVYDSKNSVVDTIQGSLKDNCTENILDSFGNFWDIYTKIQDVSDEELQEMLDDDMNRNSQKLQESLYRTINELEVTDNFGEISDDEMYEKPCHNVMGLWYSKTTNPCNSAFRLSPHEKTEEESRSKTGIDNQRCLFLSPTKACTIDMGTSFIDLAKDCYDLFEELNQNETQISNHNTACVPYTEYELAEYFNSEPRCFYAYQTLHYPSSYALAIAEFYAKREQYYQECHSYPCYSECCDICTQNYEERFEEDDSSLSPIKARIITNSAELLQNLISQKSTILPKTTAVVLEHVKELKSVQQAIQFDTRRYLTRSQLNKQNRNYIYQCSAKSNRRKNLQRNHSGANNNRKCCY